MVTIVWQGKNEIACQHNIFFYLFLNVLFLLKKCSVLEGHKVAYGWRKKKIMLGNGTLPVAALTLSEPLEPQFVEAASRTCPLRSIAGELGLARTKINMGQFRPHNTSMIIIAVAFATHKYT